MKKYLVRIVAVFFSMTAVIFAQPQAAPKYYLQINGIQGESTDQHYPGLVDVISFEEGVTNLTNTSSGATGGRANFQDLKIVKNIDKASVNLELHCANGQALIDVKLVCVRGAGNVEFYTVMLHDATVTSYKIISDGHSITEEVTFNFKKIEWNYIRTKPDGKVENPIKVQWDIGLNR